MIEITYEEVKKFLLETEFDNQPGQIEISFPIIQRIHRRLQEGNSFSAIKTRSGRIVDGVMVPTTSWKPTEILSDGFANFSTRAITSLQTIIHNTGATILLTTSHKSRFNNAEWEEIFKTRGIVSSISVLEPNEDNLNRKEEILRWFAKTNISESFVILDDDKSLNGLPEYIKCNAIITSGTLGLTIDQAKVAIDILRKEEYSIP